jgi:hypothetical protein
MHMFFKLFEEKKLMNIQYAYFMSLFKFVSCVRFRFLLLLFVLIPNLYEWLQIYKSW